MATHVIRLDRASEPDDVLRSLRTWLGNRNVAPIQTETIMRDVSDLVAEVHRSGCELLATGSNLTVTRELAFDRDIAVRLEADYSTRPPSLWQRLTRSVRGGGHG